MNERCLAALTVIGWLWAGLASGQTAVSTAARTTSLRLELGSAVAPTGDGSRVVVGALRAATGAASTVVQADEIQLLHPGLGEFGASFTFALPADLPAGIYRVQARYKSGGEVHLVHQAFTLKAGADPNRLENRARFTLSNPTPWQYQWLTADQRLVIQPGDRLLDIENSGQADAAKVFDAFQLDFEQPLTDSKAANLRQRVIAAATASPPAGPRRLYILDGTGGAALLEALTGEIGAKAVGANPTTYLAGPTAQQLAGKLQIRQLPALAVADEGYNLIGVISGPKNTAEVERFLADPAKAGSPGLPLAPAAETPRPLRSGVAPAWLIGGRHDGIAGESLHGLGTEARRRPNPAEAYFSSKLMGGESAAWTAIDSAADGTLVIDPSLPRDLSWAGGTAYASVYVRATTAKPVVLHLRHSGTTVQSWLDGTELAAPADNQSPLSLLVAGEASQRIEFTPTPGWRRLLIKFVTRQTAGQRFAFSARWTDASDQPTQAVETRLSDPDAPAAPRAVAARLLPWLHTTAPGDLPRPGEPLKLTLDLHWHPLSDLTPPNEPLPGFDALVKLRLIDYAGQEVAAREARGRVPGNVAFDFGNAPATGYYAAEITLHAADGRLIHAYPADGISVVGGTKAQRQRLAQKKIWNNNYYALADGDKGFGRAGGYFDWLERSGISRSYGGYPGFDESRRAGWEEAQRRGIVLFADSGGDSNWLNEKPEDGQAFIAAAAKYTRFFKASNELDIRQEAAFQALRDPAHWVERARWEYTAVHQARPDGHYVGASLVRPGDFANNGGFGGDLGPGRWFAEILKRGIDHYQDAWDLHAYPRNPPRLGGPIGNSETEDDRAIHAAYAKLGRKNALPFWLGEVGAKAAYGQDGRRWQAEQTAKLVAWANSRSDYLGIAFCIAHEYSQGFGRLWDYAMGHQPGEAALYTASALIDGLPYRPVDSGDAAVQAGHFGGTLMLWRDDDRTIEWPLNLDAGQKWIWVDVVGASHALTVAADGKASVRISSSPVYVLTAQDHFQLTEN